MSEENKGELTHGFNIHAGEHTHALDYMKDHMNQEQVKDMVTRAEGGHGAHFMVNHNGHQANYKLEHYDGKLIISEDHHSQ